MVTVSPAAADPVTVGVVVVSPCDKHPPGQSNLRSRQPRPIGVVHEADHAGGNGPDGFVARVDRSRDRAEHGVGVLPYFEASNVEGHPSMLRLGDRASQRTYPLADV